MPLTNDLTNRLTDLLLDIVPADTSGREALLFGSVGSDRRLTANIVVNGSTMVFIQTLISTLDNWGPIQGRPALVHFLESCRNRIGDIGNDKITRLCAEIESSANTSVAAPTAAPTLPAAPTTTPAPEAIKILFLSAEPSGQGSTMVQREMREIREQLELARKRELFEWHDATSVRFVDLTRKMLNLDPYIVHFSGHGLPTGELCLETPGGMVQPVPPNALRDLFAEFDCVKVVILNACYSKIQAEAIAEQVDYVIGMSDKITNKAAIAFSTGFYQALGAGRDIPGAYRLGRVQIQGNNTPQEHIPVLVTRQTVATTTVA